MTGQLTLHHGQNRQRTWCASTAISPGGMEPLWSPVVATGGNQRQIGRARKGRKQAKTVAVRCDRLPREVHGKQGVCGGLPPVAAGPLPAKEGVDLSVACRLSATSCCSP